MSQIYTSTLQTTLNEIKKAVPQISEDFIFKNDGSTTASEDSSEELIKNFQNYFKDLKENIALANLESITIKGVNGQVNLTNINDETYYTSISSSDADVKTLKILSNILVPTVVKLLDQIAAQPQTSQSAEELYLTAPQEVNSETQTEQQPTVQEEPDQPDEDPFSSTIDLQPVPVKQFMVEKIAGFMVAPDTVRIDNQTITHWTEHYGDKEISSVMLETLNGVIAGCKFKPIKDDKLGGKGVIQIPEKIMSELQLSQGELIMVKPVIA
jgi:predicted regulator of Ras-like GTPase activity (Roadblock/LC7/MglB family)